MNEEVEWNETAEAIFSREPWDNEGSLRGQMTQLNVKLRVEGSL